MAGFTHLPPMDGAALRARTHGMRRDLVATLEAVWRRRWTPLLCCAAGLLIGIGFSVLTPPLYKASTRIMIETSDARNGVLQSEVAIIESVPVLSKVAGTLMLYRDREFTQPRLSDVVMLRGNDENAVRDRVLGRLERMVNVHVLPDTGIIDMTVHNRNPDRAAQIANALLSGYQERKVDERFEQSRQIGGWMSKRLETIKAESAAAKKSLEEFQSAHSDITLGGANLKAERMMLLNRDMAQAQSDIAALTTRLSESRNGAQSMNDVLTSARINTLKKTETQLASTLTDLRQRYGEKHPKIVAARARLTKVQGEIASETRNVVRSIEHDVAMAKGRVDELQKQITLMTASSDDDGRLKMQLRQLESNVAANDRLYADFLMKYQDMMADAELRMADMKVISMATIPSQPDQRAKLAGVLALGVLGLVIGFLIVLLRIVWARGFTGANQMETMTGYPVVAAIPLSSVKGADVHHSVVHDPAAILAESLRSLRVSLRLRGDTARKRVVAVTSTLPDEGKTSISVMLAMIAAKSGERVCVVDCDLRRPSVHKAFGIGNARGLADYLSDRLSMDEVIYRKDSSGVHLVTAKAVPSYSLTLLTSGRMEQFIASLREQYDLIILDAPSSLAFSDARVLAHMVDQTLYVVAWNRTRRDTVMASLKPYADMGYADLALVLNKVDLTEYLRDSAASVVYDYSREQSGIQAA